MTGTAENMVLVCLGSNAPDKELEVETAADFLSYYGTVTADSGPYLTAPEGTPSDAAPYWNRILRLATATTTGRLQSIFKRYEKAARDTYQGEGVVLDIDIVADSSGILRPRDYRSRYFQQGLAKLNPTTTKK